MRNTIKEFLRPIYVPITNWYYLIFKAPKRYHHLYDVIREIKATKIMEIGVWNGKRAVRMIETAMEQADDVCYYGYDLFEDLGQEGFLDELSKMPPTETEVRESLEKTGAKIQLFKGNTRDTLPETIGRLPKMDFVFIDGGHSIETILNDWGYVQEVMDRNTVVIFDDYWRNRTDAGCKSIVDKIDRGLFSVEILPEIDSFDNQNFGRLDISFAKVILNKDLH